MLDYPAACKYFQHDLSCIHNVRPYKTSWQFGTMHVMCGVLKMKELFVINSSKLFLLVM